MFKQILLVWVILCNLELYKCAVNPDPPKSRIMYYSPSAVGEDLATYEIDLYVNSQMNLHLILVPEIKRLGATHILTGLRWDACRDQCHQLFVDFLLEQGLKLMISLEIPLDTTLEGPFKELLTLTVAEMNTIDPKGAVFDGFVIFTPQKASADDWTYIFGFVNEFSVDATPYSVYVEFPVDAVSGELLTKYNLPDVHGAKAWLLTNYADVDGWWINLYTSWQTAFQGTTQPPNFLVHVRTDSYELTSKAENQTAQKEKFVTMSEVLSALQTSDPTFTGVIVTEFSDEWWTSQNAQTGFDLEGCPNFNPYAHTPCGIRTGSYGAILSLGYQGIYSLRTSPFLFCTKPKEIAPSLANFWGMDYTPEEVCAIMFPYFTLLKPLLLLINATGQKLAMLIVGAALVLPFIISFLFTVFILTKPPRNRDCESMNCCAVKTE